MNAQLSTFSFEETPIRVLNKDGEPWFVAKDEELGGRWLVYTHWQNGKPEVGASPIPGSAHIATLEELADRIVQRDAYIFTEPEVLAKLANACLNKLAVRLQQIRK